MNDARLPATLCPECGYAFDSAESMMGHRRPEPGDLSVCLSCAALLVFDADLRPSRSATVEDVRGMPQDMALTIAAARSHIRRRGPLHHEVTHE